MENIRNIAEKYRSLMLEAERFLWQHPETGYKETVTSAYMEEKFRALGYDLVMADGITGFYTVADTGREGPEVLVLAELDSILCPSHKDADPVTGAVHSCGHHAQCAALLGIAAALREKEILSGLCGRIRLCAVPAEELLEIEYRSQLRAQGKIRYLGGKTEFMHRGYFDGVDLALMVHTAGSFSVSGGSVGCLLKNIIYKGVAAHAGGSPWSGRNALYAATCGINAVNAIRETFPEPDIIRVHPIITHGGDMVNAIPETVTLESYVRGSSFDAITRANTRVNRALTGAAYSLGTNVEIIDTPGYGPFRNAPAMMKLAEDAARLAIPERPLHVSNHIGSGSTDMGDLCAVMPVVQPYAGGAAGRGHGNDYEIRDPEAACVDSAKWQLGMIRLLLENKAARAKEIIEGFTPAFPSIRAYLDYIDTLCASGDRIEYREDGTAVVR
ncbi:MAG: amidohydrolase [Clostridia bacterium]|nr:amidohydrolase [Clostridia bacterium]